MNYSTIKTHDIANGPGVRVSLFVSGCRHHCRGCFNPETWDFHNGKLFTPEVMEEILNACDHKYITGLSLLGGEPFEPENAVSLLTLVSAFKKKFPEKTIWCYTGYRIDEIVAGKLKTWHSEYEMTEDELKVAKALLNYIDILVDGEFIMDKKDLKLRFRGSSNQRVLYAKKFMQTNNIVLWDDNTGIYMNI